MPEDISRTLFKVVKIISDSRVVINAGTRDGIKTGNRFIIYKTGEAITDPDTGEDLGPLEIVKGNGVAKHVQEKMSIIHGYMIITKKQRPSNMAAAALYSIYMQGPIEETEEIEEAFEMPEIGDCAKRK
ncbi:hypothetical protein FVW20_02955 [Desulfovibrio oxamicus]|uniref:Uncharacterized protein n=1 Tax=Nitratidesulfovibrio oxamicus TaxID=32016 RepID=A0ABS0J0R4_9BACT|nr:hypothetical protein [Nitratidesulfovibrio oxamicus]MBG3876011.1 hypothetical protein [Nitratidesulfovibrio oxamicus]